MFTPATLCRANSSRALSALVLAAFSALHLSAQAQDIRITTLSSRPGMISGGDVLVEIAVPPLVALADAAVKLNGQDVTSSFHRSAARHTLLGLVAGLKSGPNTLEVFTGGRYAAHAIFTDYPITGPIFSGPQEHPFLCQTQLFDLPNGQSLGDPIDNDCSVKTVVSYVYKSTEPPPPGSLPGYINLKPLADLHTLPADVAMATTTTGQTVPYVVRVETGIINRSIYQFAVLSDPTKEPEPSPFTPPRAWNGRLLFSFGGGCPGGWYRQGYRLGWGTGSRGTGREEAAPTATPAIDKPQGPGSAVFSDDVVGRGYAEAASTLNAAMNNCNDVISAETMMMVKERFIKAFGRPAFTFGRGGSGGSYQQNQIADRYPGLLDGIIPSMTFPDVQELTQMLTDSRLLDNYFTVIGDALTGEQKRAISGVAELKNIPASAPLAGRINPTEYCPPGLPFELRFDLKKNTTGVRCDLYDHNVNLYGKDPATGFAWHPIDNTGVQYGLAALNDGVISVDQFLDLNEKIGGYDRNGYVSPLRSVADPDGLRAAYRNDLITYGSNLALVPIIDVRPYRDRMPKGDNHLKYHSFTLRARLEQANGTAANDVMITGSMAEFRRMEDYAIDAMDRWLTALAKDASNDPLPRKIIRAKPADLVDSCWTAKGERINEPQTWSGGECNQLYPAAPSPRMVAGASLLGNNVLKCRLKPIDPADYKAALSAGQLTRLKAIFPDGVCDWTRPGVEQQPPTIGSWHAF